MKLDQVFQSLLLTGAVVVFISTPAKGEEVRKDVQGKSSTATVGKFTLGKKVAATGQELALTKSSVLTPGSIRNRLKEDKILNSLRRSKFDEATKNISQLSEVKFPATSARMLVQAPTPTNPTNAPPVEGGNQGGIVPITGVKANPTDKGVEIILQTTQGQQLQVTNRSTGNNFVADISGGQLRLPSGEAFTFRSEKPLAGITEIKVTNVDANTVRVTVVGEASQPTVELFDDDTGLVFGVAGAATATQPQPEAPQTTEKPATEAPQEEPAAQQDDPIELVVTGEQDGYRAPNATTATRTDTPIRDIPQSIQVVPQEVLRDRNVRTLTEAVETVSGVVAGDSIVGSSATSRFIRGFEQAGNFRNGYRDANSNILSSPIGTIEQVEVLKGPASVIFGDLEPGGIVNITTKKPLSEPFYSVAFEAGNYGFYQPSVDLSGPLTIERNLLYRFIAGYKSTGDVQDFVNINELGVSPSITWKIGDNTEMNLYYEYTDFTAEPPTSLSSVLSDGRLTPRNFFTSYPNFYDAKQSAQRFGYTFTHKLSDKWQIRNNFAGLISKVDETRTAAVAVEDDRFLRIESYDSDYGYDNYFGQIDLLGKFKTGSISHQLLIGFDVNDYTDTYQALFNTNLPLLDLRNPNYDVPKPIYDPFLKFQNRVRSYGLYLQDQVTFAENFKLLLGGRYDWVSSTFEIGDFGALANTTDEPERNAAAFSPRIGLVYQPSDTISLYASYSSSFRAQTGFSSSTQGFDPTRGAQYEVGIKADWLEGRLSTTLAAYHLTKTNVITTDPNNSLFSIQTGEQRSQGIEFDVAGEILPGWKVIASYAYTDAEVTEDNTIPVGNQLNNVPTNQASLWTTYEIQRGNLQGIGFGFGLFYVDSRQGDLDNSFQVKDYLRSDAALYYRRDRFQAALNVRNLFDIDYAISSYSRTYIRRGEPFTIIGSIRWEF
ncbi:ferrichrome-iron receptor [Rivularia sp. IAM M-261]|nr:ferrichrome-iron receptor [Rivularia sp. IAM M-261]